MPKLQMFRLRVVSYLPLLLVVLLGVPAMLRAQTKPTSNTTTLQSLETSIVAEMNLARTNPKQYARFLEESKKFYNGKQYHPPNGPVYTTNEGVKALDEAIAFLRVEKPLTPLTVSGGMCSAAKDHVKDLTSSGISGHKGSDGSTTEDRVNRYGKWSSAIGENIAYESSSAREVVIGWIIDDGLASRGHRKHLFDPNYRVVGIALGSGHSGTSAPMCVTTFAGGFSDNPRKSAGSSAAQRQR